MQSSRTSAAVPRPSFPSLVPPLAQQLAAAARALAAVRDGQSATAALLDVPAPLRPGVQALVFHALRHLGMAQVLRRQLAARAPAPMLDALLCLTLSLARGEPGRYEDGLDTVPRYSAFTLVDQAVKAARLLGFARQAGFVNACLRRFLREQGALVQTALADVQARWNHPHWWVRKLRHQYPDDWQAVLAASNAQPPMTLRVNPRHAGGNRQAYLALLRQAGLDATPVGTHGLKLHRAVPVAQLPLWGEGGVSVQDAAAQLAAPLLLGALAVHHVDLSELARRPLHVLDACAAPGGKTAHLLEAAPPETLRVVALEIDPERVGRIHDTLARTGLAQQAQVMVADAAQPGQWWQQANGGQAFDGILLDAPCSASGIVRRHPDVRWLRRESDIAQLARIQAGLLDALWPLLAPGGVLLYATCSIFREEGEDQIRAFVRRCGNVVRLPAPGHLLPGIRTKGAKDPALPLAGASPRGACFESAQMPGEALAYAGLEWTHGGDNTGIFDHDGFFYALLQKRPASATGAP